MVDPVRREYLLDQAILAGKFPEQRRAHWSEQYDRDPVGTEQVFASLASLPKVAADARPYPQGLFPELQRQPHQPRPAAPPALPAAHAEPVEAASASADTPEAEVVSGWTATMFPETAARGSSRVTRAHDA
jgi:hypothetical protein